MARANQSTTERLPVVGLLILLLLIGQFNSVRRTAIILVTIPLGVVAGLILAQSYVRFMTLLGIVALAGIIISHGIVLIDRIRIEIDDNGLDPPRAIVESAQSRYSQWSRLPLVRILNEGNAPAADGSRLLRSNRARAVLATVQVALALVLSVGAGLLLRSFAQLVSVDPGYVPANALTARVGDQHGSDRAPRRRYRGGAQEAGGAERQVVVARFGDEVTLKRFVRIDERHVELRPESTTPSIASWSSTWPSTSCRSRTSRSGRSSASCATRATKAVEARASDRAVRRGRS